MPLYVNIFKYTFKIAFLIITDFIDSMCVWNINKNPKMQNSEDPCCHICKAEGKFHFPRI